MFGFLMWFVSARRAQSAMRRGDLPRAKEIFEKFLGRVPRSRLGWASLTAVSIQAGDSPEERLALARRAWAAVPYDFSCASTLVAHLLNSLLVTNDRRFLVEAKGVLSEFESLLGESGESWILRSDIAQLEGDMELARSLCERAEEALVAERPGPLAARLAMCMASIRGKEDRAIEMLEQVPAKANYYGFRMFLALLLEPRDPARSERVKARAKAEAARALVSPEAFERNFQEMRAGSQRERAYMSRDRDYAS